MLQSKSGVAALSVASNTTLVIVKLAVGLATGSISVISEAIHSGMDLVAALVALFSVRFSSRPADLSHPYGHGKMENISGAVEALLILVAAAFIIYEATRKMIYGTHLLNLELGMGVMLFSVVVNILVSRQLRRVAKATDSLALEADAWHLTTDVWTSLAVLVGLGLVRLSGWHFLDPLAALVVAALIVKVAVDLTGKSLGGLLDTSLPDQERERIEAIVRKHAGELVEIHQLRSRKAGAERHLDFHLVVNKEETVEQAHTLADDLEEHIRQELPHTTVVIHLEPCDPTECARCASLCQRREQGKASQGT